MTADQLGRLKKVRQMLDDIRGNEDEVAELKHEIDSLIHDSVSDIKAKINVLASPEGEESIDDPWKGNPIVPPSKKSIHEDLSE